MVRILLAEGREGKLCFSMVLQCFWPRLWRVFSHAVAIRWLNEAGLKRGGVLQIDANCYNAITQCQVVISFISSFFLSSQQIALLKTQMCRTHHL